MADIKTGTDKAELKLLLHKATEEHPMRCAVAQPKEGQFSLLVVDKTKQSRALSTELEKDFAGAKNPRWGTVFADENRLPPEPGAAPQEDVDAKLVIFLLNRPASGLAKRIAKTLKLNRTGFSKVELRFEDGSPSEREAEEEDEEQAPAAKAAPVPPAPPQPAAAAAAQAPDPAMLHHGLGELIGRIATASAGDDALRAKLAALAGAANTLLKGGSPAEAAAKIAELKAAIEGAHPATAAAPAGAQGAAQSAAQPGAKAAGGPVAYAKSRLAWLAARKKMEAEVEKLRAAILEFYKDDEIGNELDAAYHKRVAPMLEALDEELADGLDAATNEADAAKRAELVAEARKTIARYQDFLSGDGTIAALDQNPFVPLTIQPTIAATLTALAASVH